MSKDTQYGCPLFIDKFKDGASSPMERITFSKRGPESVDYDEAWLQRLIMSHPRLLPVDQIEPGFAGLVPICIELETGSGYLDNLLVTPSGNIALIECKLWRNPEARREVVGQIIDYAKEISAWDYQNLEEAIGRSKSPAGGDGERPRKLYEAVSEREETDEQTFIDAVSRNLRRGRFLLLIVGDGIREGVESMTEFLQQYAGLHFTLAIVELALFKVSTGGYIAQPRVLARTTNIDRGIVTVDEKGRVTIGPARAVGPNPVVGTRMTITKEQYLERLEENLPGVKDRLNEFIGKLEMYGVFPAFGANSMILKWPNETKDWNLGVIASSGAVFTDNTCGQARDGNLLHVAKQYVTSLKELVPGAELRPNRTNTAFGAVKNGRSITVDALLANETSEDGWIHAIARFQSSVTKSSQGESQNADQGPPMSASNEVTTGRETVLQVGAEGGSITLLRERKAGEDWRFQMKRDETTLYDLLSEEDRNEIGQYFAQTGYVPSFHEGLRLLDRYPWFRLHPLEVHPEYLDAVLRAVRERGGAAEEARWREQLVLRRE